MTDYPHIRANYTCPFCDNSKNKDLLACWSCFRGLGLHDGETAVQQMLLEIYEYVLATLAEKR